MTYLLTTDNDAKKTECLTGAVVEKACLYDVSDTQSSTLSYDDCSMCSFHNDRLFSVPAERVLNTKTDSTSISRPRSG